jgi:hypothetical protein
MLKEGSKAPDFKLEALCAWLGSTPRAAPR